MPIRRFGRKKRSMPRNKMLGRRRRVGLRRPRQPVHYFKRVCKISDITASFNSVGPVTTNIAGTYALSLDSLPNYTEFTSLYDQYCIKGIRLSFVPSGNSAVYSTASGSAAAIGFSRFNSAIDYDDSAVPANENELLQYQTLRQTPGWKTHTRYFKPKVQFTVADNDVVGTTANAAPRSNVWLDCANPTVDHLGLKVWCAAPINTATSTSITYSVYATFYMAFKNVR